MTFSIMILSNYPNSFLFLFLIRNKFFLDIFYINTFLYVYIFYMSIFFICLFGFVCSGSLNGKRSIVGSETANDRCAGTEMRGSFA